MTRPGWHVVALTVLVIGAASPAAADTEIGLSVDGATWAPTLTAPLFDPDLRWVPGDTRSATFYVRNQSDDVATLSVDVLGTALHTLLDTGDLRISARGDGIDWRATSRPGTHRLVSDVAVPAGASTPIDVTVALAPGSSNESMRRQLDLRFRLSLTQRSAVGPDGGGLPDTGAPGAWDLVLGIALVAGGIIATSRRPEREDAHV
ncbi:hypothetical protein [Aeromicrobium sp. 9AM]|uniref:hypothetical protein n=1 Tax=Aeromicrobium sp. 9AM TaxID=2653126 RepID=UPI0012F0BA3D|nr:hypothetical protein [Aeromicrobium sp. 9AM]VXB39964.1 LPXTG-motif cell wall anchor domain protein [Aeromicrobium sp. 9AM]